MFFKSVFTAKKDRLYSKIEKHVFGMVNELLKVSSTDINTDEMEGKYYLCNPELQFRVTVISDECIIKLTNTDISIVEKYERYFIEDILRIIKLEKRQRIDFVADSIAGSIEKMAEHLHNSLLESNRDCSILCDFDADCSA